MASRYAELHEVAHAAADSGEDDLRDLWQLEEGQRLTGARLWAELLTGKGPLRPGLDPSTAVDVLWLLMSPDAYHRLVHQRRWTARQYQQWLAGSIAQLLFAPTPEV